MNDSLQDVISAAVEGIAAKTALVEGAGRRTTQLRAVSTAEPILGSAPLKPTTATDEVGPIAAMFAAEGDRLGRNGLRLSFWLCGFHQTLRDRVRGGETLSEREESLLALSRKDFVTIRPVVIGMALERLEAVVNASGELSETAMEAFALETLRALSVRASDLLRDAGADRALSLFGDAQAVNEPLAIFQLIFSTALGLVESFIHLIPGPSVQLDELAATLGSEVERI